MYVLVIIPPGRIWLIYKGGKCPRGEFLSISYTPTGGVLIDLFPVARFSFEMRAVRQLDSHL